MFKGITLSGVVDWLGGRKFAIWILGVVLYFLNPGLFGPETYQWLTVAFMLGDAVDRGVAATTNDEPIPKGLGWIAHILGGRRMTAFYVTTLLAIFGIMPGSVWAAVAISATGAFAVQEIPKLAGKRI